VRRGFWIELLAEKKAKSHFYWTIPDSNYDEQEPENETITEREHRLEWQAARDEFSCATQEQREKWWALTTLRIDRWETPSLTRRRTRLTFISVIFLSALIGLMPSKIPVLDVSITANTSELIIFTFFISHLFSYITYTVSIREFIIRKQIINQELKNLGFFISKNNSLQKYIDANLKEMHLIYHTVPTVISKLLFSCYILRAFYKVLIIPLLGKYINF